MAYQRSDDIWTNLLFKNHWWTAVLINSAKIAKDLLKTPALSYRETKYTQQIFLDKSTDGSHSFVLLNGSEWSTARRLMHTKLIRILTTKFVNDIFAESIKNELKPHLNNIINKMNGIWYPREIATHLMFNTIFKANFGEKYDKTNFMHQKFVKGMMKVASPNVCLKSVLLMIMPFLKYITSFQAELDEIVTTNEAIINELLKNHERATDKDKMSFIDYNIELKENEQISEGRVIADIILTFAAGTETTANTFEYGMVLLAKQPKIQQLVRNELLKNKNIEEIIYDIQVLLMVPHFRALIHEILR